MFFQNLSKLNISTIKKSISIMLCLSLFACSSTERLNDNYFNDNGYARGFVNEHFANASFIPMSRNAAKKELPSDHQLMMSLLNRPITADQALMIAFAQVRANYGGSYSNYGVEIKGDKNSDQADNKSNHAYSTLISQDINAVNISAPQ